jgi:transposase
MFKSDITSEKQLFAFTPRDLIPENSDTWLYIDLFDQLDCEAFEWDYCSQGENAHDPRFMLRTIFYGLTHGVVSGRKLADSCVHDSRYVVLSGGRYPSYRTFSRFVLRHQKRLEDFFVQVVCLAQRMDLVSLGRIAIDGSKFKANTSKHRAMSYGRMKEAIKKLKAELAELRSSLQDENGVEKHESRIPKEIQIREKRLEKIKAAKAALEKESRDEEVDDKRQKSFNDHDALPFKKRSGDFSYVYNCQAAVDEDNQIIVAADIQNNTKDSPALTGLLDGIEENCGDGADEVLADSGYKSYANIDECDEHGSKAYFALGKGEDSRDRVPIQDLKYYAKQDHYRCMRGKVLKNVSKQDESTSRRGLMIPKKDCSGCPHLKYCSIFKKRGKAFWVPAGKYKDSARRYENRMRTDEGREIYRRRKAIVETIFGNIKNKGMRITVTGAAKVSCWWKMACTAHNVEKLIKNWRKLLKRGLFFIAACYRLFQIQIVQSFSMAFVR